MAVSITSRFSVLQVEDDDSDDMSDSGTKGLSNAANKKGGKAPIPIVQPKTKPKKKKSSNNDSAELQNLIFGTGKNKSKAGGGPNKGIVKESQWQEWKEKDSKYVSESYEQDLQKALLLSKVQFEENKEFISLIKAQQQAHQASGGESREGGEIGKRTKKKSGASKKDKGQTQTTMSLEKFNTLLPSQIDAGVHNLVTSNGDLRHSENESPDKRTGSISEPDFFHQIEEDAGKIIKSEERKEKFKKNEPFIAEQALSLELRDELEKKDKLIEELTSANVKLKEDLKSVKYRNKKLCNILAQGEMRDKAEILVQVEKMITIRDELTQEVAALHGALEQEKSKVHSLQSDLKKQQSGKKEPKKDPVS